ncbi:hypothetical protein [Suttonella indologenes]|nr:hypothetical protein [Suttonella indologenes]
MDKDNSSSVPTADTTQSDMRGKNVQAVLMNVNNSGYISEGKLYGQTRL